MLKTLQMNLVSSQIMHIFQKKNYLKLVLDIIPGKRQLLSPRPIFKKNKISHIQDECQLRIRKMEDAINQQELLHKAKMEVVLAEKEYWQKRTALLEENN